MDATVRTVSRRDPSLRAVTVRVVDDAEIGLKLALLDLEDEFPLVASWVDVTFVLTHVSLPASCPEPRDRICYCGFLVNSNKACAKVASTTRRRMNCPTLIRITVTAAGRSQCHLGNLPGGSQFPDRSPPVAKTDVGAFPCRDPCPHPLLVFHRRIVDGTQIRLEFPFLYLECKLVGSGLGIGTTLVLTHPVERYKVIWISYIQYTGR